MAYDLSNPREGLYFGQWINRTWRTSRVGAFVIRHQPQIGEPANAAVWLAVCLGNLDVAMRHLFPIQNHPFWGAVTLFWTFSLLIFTRRFIRAIVVGVRRSRP